MNSHDTRKVKASSASTTRFMPARRPDRTAARVAAIPRGGRSRARTGLRPRRRDRRRRGRTPRARRCGNVRRARADRAAMSTAGTCRVPNRHTQPDYAQQQRNDQTRAIDDIAGARRCRQNDRDWRKCQQRRHAIKRVDHHQHLRSASRADRYGCDRSFEPHPAAAARCGGALADQFDSIGGKGIDQLHQRVHVAADHAVACFHPLNGWQRQTRSAAPTRAGRCRAERVRPAFAPR